MANTKKKIFTVVLRIKYISPYGKPINIMSFLLYNILRQTGNTIDVCQHEHFDCNNVVCV